MQTKKVILFTINNEVIVEEEKSMTVEEIETMRLVIADECDCPVFFVKVEVIDEAVINSMVNELSHIDLTDTGLLDWQDSQFREIIGVKLTLIEGSDEYLDAVLNNTLDQHLIFLKAD